MLSSPVALLFRRDLTHFFSSSKLNSSVLIGSSWCITVLVGLEVIVGWRSSGLFAPLFVPFLSVNSFTVSHTIFDLRCSIVTSISSNFFLVYRSCSFVYASLRSSLASSSLLVFLLVLTFSQRSEASSTACL